MQVRAYTRNVRVHDIHDFHATLVLGISTQQYKIQRSHWLPVAVLAVSGKHAHHLVQYDIGFGQISGSALDEPVHQWSAQIVQDQEATRQLTHSWS